MVLDPVTNRVLDANAAAERLLGYRREELVAMRESDYYASLLAFYRPVRAMIWGTALLIALGGLLGGLGAGGGAGASATSA